MKTKQKRYHSNIPHWTKYCYLVLLMIVAGCGGQEELIEENENKDKIQLSDKEITIGVDGWKPLTESRAAIFENKNDIENDAADAKGGGNFTLHAYRKEIGSTFIDGTRVRYFIPDGQTDGSWRFYAHPNFIEYYWPQSGSIDFFAYMPYKGSDRQKSISVGSYSNTTGLNITCQMQATTADDNNDTDDLLDPKGQETIIAYTTGKSKSDGSVNMYFVHPFSAIYLKLKQAHRDLNINWIKFNNVYLKGEATLNATTDKDTKIQWTPDGNAETFTIPVDKIIPGQINFNGEVGGPYLVMPQSFGKNTASTDDDVTITVNYTWDDQIAETDNTQEFTRSITTTSITEWIAGNKYTYLLYLGDNAEEILFKVLVEPWGSNEYKNIIDVE